VQVGEAGTAVYILLFYKSIKSFAVAGPRFDTYPVSAIRWGFRTMPISVPGHADHLFRDDGDHDSGMIPITRSGMIPIS
jgi:hypothetical protein